MHLLKRTVHDRHKPIGLACNPIFAFEILENTIMS